MNRSENDAHGASAWARARHLASRAIRVELRIYASIARLIARKPALPAGASGFSYHKPVQTILVVFIVLSAVEIPIIDLIVHRWPPVRIAVLALGIWGLTWMVGVLAAHIVRPHTVGPQGIRVREGLELDVALDWDDVRSVALSRRVDEPKSPRVVETATEASNPDDSTATISRTLCLRVQHETNLEIVLERPCAVRLPGLAPRGGVQTVDRVRLHADDPRAFLAAVREHLRAFEDA